MIVGGKARGWQIFGKRNVPLREIRADGVDLGAHHANFLDAIRTGATPNATIEVNHLSTALCHLGNMAARTRAALEFDPASERFRTESPASALLRREYRDHWAAPRA